MPHEQEREREGAAKEEEEERGQQETLPPALTDCLSAFVRSLVVEEKSRFLVRM